MRSMFRMMMGGVLATTVFAGSASADSRSDQIPLLIKSLSDANVRQGASLVLTKIGAIAVPALRTSLSEGTGNGRVWAAHTLGQIGPPAEPAVGDLVKALTEADPALRAAAAQALGKIGPSAKKAVDPLANSLSDAHPSVRQRAVVALGQVGPSAKNATGKLIGVLSDSRLRSLARTALIRIGPAAAKPLRTSLKDDKLRFDILMVLRAIDPKSNERRPTAADLASLRLVLNDPTRDSTDQVAAAKGLVLSGKEGVAVLIAAFEDQRIARTSAEAFAHAGPVAVPALIKELAHKDPEVRAKAADAIGQIGPAASAALKHLVKLLGDSDRTVRFRAVLALHTFGKKATPAIPALIKVINNNKGLEPTRHWAIKTLIITLPETRDVVVKALIFAAKDKANYGVSQLARQQIRRIDLKAAEAAGVK